MRLYIVVLAALFFFITPAVSFAASVYISPSSGSYSVGDTIVVRVLVSSPDASINAVSGSLSFSPTSFTVSSISKSSSVLNFWPSDPSISPSGASFEGVSLSGFQGSAGNVVTITLRAARAGTGVISFQNGQVLLNDGAGSDAHATLSGASYNIVAREAAPTPTPLPTLTPTPVATTTPATTTPIMVTTSLDATTTPEANTSEFNWLLIVYTLGALLLMLGCVLLGMLIHKISHETQTPRMLKHKEIAKTYTLIHEQFAELRDAVEEEVAALKRVHTKRALTGEEQRLINRFEKLINKAERSIEKEVDSITK